MHTLSGNQTWVGSVSLASGCHHFLVVCTFWCLSYYSETSLGISQGFNSQGVDLCGLPGYLLPWGLSCTSQLALGLLLTQHTWVDPSQTLLLPAAPGQISRSPVAPRLEGKMGILRAGSTSVPTVMSL